MKRSGWLLVLGCFGISPGWAVEWQDYPLPPAGQAVPVIPPGYTAPAYYVMPEDYHSPYAVDFSGLPFGEKDVLYDFNGRLDEAMRRTNVPLALWYDRQAYGRGSQYRGDVTWGPAVVGSLGNPQPTSPPPAGFGSTAWKQQRVIAFARQFQNVANGAYATIYQHHHLPMWSPNYAGPNPWPWNPGREFPIAWGTANGGSPRASAGVDCSNFTALVYNLALGYHLNSDVHMQSHVESAIQRAPEGGGVVPQVIAGPTMNTQATIDPYAEGAEEQYRALVSRFQPGDLLFMHSSTGGRFANVHVVIWLGTQNVTYTNGNEETAGATIPLVIGSHNDTQATWDENGELPPPGVQVVPFAADSWLYKNFDHALRIIGTEGM